MSNSELWQIGFFCLALALLTPLLGTYMSKIFSGEKHFLSKLKPVENLIYRIAFINPHEHMSSKKYAYALLVSSFLSFILLFCLQIFQALLPLNPENFSGLSLPLAFNTALSFVTNTNWQAYSGESTLSYFTQTFGLSVQNFVSAAMGLCVLLAFIRGLLGKETCSLGNFWVDMTRAILYLLLPLASFLALMLISQGVIQNFGPYIHAVSFEGASQILPMGPVASQEAIKQLGSNGGGFFGTNSAHPFENPNAFANFLSMLAMLLVPSASIYMFAAMTKARKHAAALYITMVFFLGSFVCIGNYVEHRTNNALVLTQNLEGKETRFGLSTSILFAMITSASSNGAVNAMHDSLSPLGGGLCLLQILMGGVIFGGVGSGLYSMLLFVIFALFLSGLMIGRSPEYFGKKIEDREIKLVLIALLLPSALVLIGSSLAFLYPQALMSIKNHGPHGLSEILYAFASAANNNGSAFAGLESNTLFYNLALGLAMLIGRFGVMLPVLGLAGAFAAKKIAPSTQNSLQTHGFTFVLLLIFIILILSALTYMPALILGPVAEYFLMNMGVSF